MKTLIENYRGWDIFFDNDKENFYTSSDEWDRQNTKTSYSATKKFIDDFIKENLEFKPVWIEKPSSIYGSNFKIKLIGIRKDKRFIFEGKDGKPEQLSEYNEKDYILINELNESIYNEMQKLRDDIDIIMEKLKDLEKQIIKDGIQSIKEKYTI